ncbi:uncharacterized protein BJ212DRAFT_1487391 [Suillus subaureus]|uniref:Uncharacterized protein n=1 Tax=Suillus subaureus TaxID=48587 RepID=A0A9P7DTA0_9AGAM|nr:uncharacterized protein BJ212DRAFT_1487391 [Suillus subaureus]KAG1802380.1 hypothetical protein BJ212DRAFT_1487391 [Suillus subaureus]
MHDPFTVDYNPTEQLTQQQDNDGDHEMLDVLPCLDFSGPPHPVLVLDVVHNLNKGIDNINLDTPSPLSSIVNKQTSCTQDHTEDTDNATQIMTDAQLPAKLDTYESQHCSVCPKHVPTPCATPTSSCDPSKCPHTSLFHSYTPTHFMMDPNSDLAYMSNEDFDLDDDIDIYTAAPCPFDLDDIPVVQEVNDDKAVPQDAIFDGLFLHQEGTPGNGPT